MLKHVLRFLIFLAIVTAAAELVLRYKFGFLSTPLYVSDPDYEYIYAPNQDVRRFGNHIKTNEYSMRSNPLQPADTTVILLTGDSVVLGGSLTDNDSLASTKLEKRLTLGLGRPVRVLNIAAGSWGAGNVAGYLRKYGLFNADLICLIASSHDAHETLDPNANIVGINPNMPDKQYDFALEELWKRYIYPRYLQGLDVNSNSFAPTQDHPESGIHKEGSGFDPGFRQLAAMARRAGVPFFILLHPEISEIEAGQYNYEGQQIIHFAKTDSVRLIKELDLGTSTRYYRDGDVVHYNDSGQNFLADKLYPIFLDYLKTEK